MCKRKFDSEDASEDRSVKQLKLVPFPNYQNDMDVDMSDSSSSVPSPYTPLNDNYHYRHDSGASAYSSSSEGAACDFPSFDVRPEPFFHADGSVNIDSHNFARIATPPHEVGLIQPKSSFMHNGACTQIPKLRIACSSGLNGSRTMWSHCEQCGAIEMLDPDY